MTRMDAPLRPGAHSKPDQGEIGRASPTTAGRHSTNEIEISAPPSAVFAMLADPTSYPDWLVGAARVPTVDEAWPAIGSRFSHRLGVRFLWMAGSTTVVECVLAERFVLAAGMGPLGEAIVQFDLAPSSQGTHLRVSETPRNGIVRIAGALAWPLVRSMLWGRNELSLGRLRDVIEAQAEVLRA